MAVSGGAFLVGFLEMIVLGMTVGLFLGFLSEMEAISAFIAFGAIVGVFSGVVYGVVQSLICRHFVAQAEPWQDEDYDHGALLIKLGAANDLVETGHRVLRRGGTIYKIVIPRPDDDEFEVYLREQRWFAKATVSIDAKISITIKPYQDSDDFLGFKPTELARIVASDSYLDVKAWIRGFFMKAISDSPSYERVIWECSQTGNTSALLRLIDVAIPTFSKIVRGKLSNIIDTRVGYGDFEITVTPHAQMTSEQILEKGLRTE